MEPSKVPDFYVKYRVSQTAIVDGIAFDELEN
jgi:hypothetical protein